MNKLNSKEIANNFLKFVLYKDDNSGLEKIRYTPNARGQF